MQSVAYFCGPVCPECHLLGGGVFEGGSTGRGVGEKGAGQVDRPLVSCSESAAHAMRRPSVAGKAVSTRRGQCRVKLAASSCKTSSPTPSPSPLHPTPLPFIKQSILPPAFERK